MGKTVTLKNGSTVASIGLGTWFLGDDPAVRSQEIAALEAGLECGANLIDTAEMYGSGRSESLVGEVLCQAPRDDLFVVSKVLPQNASQAAMATACYGSLERLQTDYLDLYLYHWRGSYPLAETVEALADLQSEGVIRAWGVSNLDLADMRELWSLERGTDCQVNQLLYHLASRGIEYDLLPEMLDREVALMAYCPLAQGATLRQGSGLFTHPAVVQVAQKHGVSPAQVLLAFVIRNGQTIAIPRSGSLVHTEDNVRALNLELDSQDLAHLERAFPAPTRSLPLDME